jgi:hypothetical protein
MLNHSTNIKKTEQHSHPKQMETTTAYGFEKLGPVLIGTKCGLLNRLMGYQPYPS